MRQMTKGITLLALGAAYAASAPAGVYVEMTDRDLANNTRDLAQKLYIQGNKGRFVDADGRATILQNGTLYMIDDAKKTYVVFDQATMSALASQLNAVVEQAKEQIAKLPPEARPQAEKQLAQQMPGMTDGKAWVVEAVDTGQTDKVEGRSCRVWNMKRNGELDDQLCVVPYGSLPGKENFQAVFAEFSKAFEEMAKSVPMLAGAMTNEFAAQAKVNGFPVRSRAYENGKLVDVEQVMTLWREETFPASMFEVPAGYQKEQMQLGGN
jgi:hypothetical protein